MPPTRRRRAQERLFPFWKFPEDIDVRRPARPPSARVWTRGAPAQAETFGAKGLMDEGLFPYREYKMLGGMPFQPIQIE